MNNPSYIYLDNNATTPCDPRVVEKMLPYFSQYYGNASNGLNALGRLSARIVEESREEVARIINASPEEIIFTGGATESDNLAILGFARSHQSNHRKRIVTSQIEHKAVINACHRLEKEGFEIFFLPVHPNGVVDLDKAHTLINDQTLLVSVQLANNEIGTIQPVRELADITHNVGALFHCDAAQAVGKIPVDVFELGIDLLSISAHKLYGPKGIGALFIRGGSRSVVLEPLQYGGGQENGVRPGTANVPAIVGFGEACKIVWESLPEEALRITGLRELFEMLLSSSISGLMINGKVSPRLPNTSSLTIPGVDADALLFNMTYTLMGTGSACTSGAMEPSHVLQAIGLSRVEAASTIRAGLGRFTQESEIKLAAIEVKEAVDQLLEV